MHREIKHLAAALILTTCSSGALHAGTSYIPLPAARTNGDAGHEVQVSVTNPAHAPRTIEVHQIGSGIGDTPPVARTPVRQAVGAGRTIVLAPEPVPGLLEITAPDGVALGVRLVGAGARTGLGSQLPAIPSEAVGAAGETLLVQELRNSATRRTDLVVVNLGRLSARCDAVVRRADGGAVVLAKSLVLLARSSLPLRDVFGPESLEEGEAAITCDGEFLAFAQLDDRATGQLEVAALARRGGAKSRGSAAASCPPSKAGKTCFAWPGVVHTSTAAHPVRHLYPPVAPGTYGAVHVRLAVQVNGWNQDHKPNAAHGVLYFVRNGNKEMWASLLLRPLGILGLRHGFFKTHGQKAVVDHKFKPELGRTYEFDYLYDTRKRRITLRVLLDGRLVHRIQQRPDVRNVTIGRRDRVWIGLSNPGLYKPEPYSRGWIYSNLLVEFFG